MIHKSDIKVLIAEDDPDVLQITSKKINQAGYQVIMASDGDEALKKIYDEKPHVVVSDIAMPGKDGLEILKAIREKAPGAGWTSFILVTGRNELNDMRAGYNLEADHYITKPCQATDILKAIDLMIKLNSQRSATE